MLRSSALPVETRLHQEESELGQYETKLDIYFYNCLKSGRIKKQMVQKYVRWDVSCGLNSCSCTKRQKDLHRLSPKDPTTMPNRVMRLPHVIIVDSRVLIKYFDLFMENNFENVMIPLSAWKTLKLTKRKMYTKFRELYENNPTRYFVFGNDSFGPTMSMVPLSRVDGENTLATLTATYLFEHWRDFKVVPLVVTDSESDMNFIARKYKYVTTLLNYVKGMDKSEERTMLIQRVKELAKVEDKGRNRQRFANHWSDRDLDAGIRSGTVKIGNFAVTIENRHEAFVQVSDTMRVLVHGLQDMNRAINGDTVAVFLFPNNKWRAPEGRFRIKDLDDEVPNEEESEDDAKTEKKKTAVVPTGRVVAVVKRSLKQYCGILESPTNKNGSMCIFRPADRLIPPVIIDTRAYTSALNNKVICSIVRWPVDSWLPQGTLIRVIGDIGKRDVEDEVILLEHDVRFRPFTAAERAELPKGEWKPASPLEPYRVDLTYLDICSVDPPGCTDIDDALHFRKISKGLYEVGVHIADVSHFVRAGSPLDLEASRRCTSVYLCNRRIDMLPELLSSELCSLRGDVLRYAFSVIWELDENAEIKSTRFTKSLIKSRAALTYQQAQDLVDGKEVEVKNKKRLAEDGESSMIEVAVETPVLKTLTDSLRGLMRLSKILREKRRKRGSLTLASMEIRFDYDEEGNPVGVMQKKALDTMSMIEEFMLLANVSVAEEILKNFPGAAMLRRHPTPTVDAFQPLIDAGKEMGFDIKVDSNQALSESLDKAVDVKNSESNNILRMMATRCMTQALYFPAGTVPTDQYRHYGLAIPIYTHFTSPIRRYADVIVHRQLAVLLGVFKKEAMSKMFSRAHLINVSDEMNRRNRLAQRANRASVVLNAQYLLDNKPTETDGFITQLKDNGVSVVVPRYGVETIVEFPPNCNVKLNLFQKVKVKLEVVEKNQRRMLNMEIIDPKISAEVTEVEASEMPLA